MRKILHLHGIGSAGGGATASVLKKLFSDIEVISPDIPVRPLEAFAFISKLVAGNEFDFVVGTSLGGFYAMLIKGIPKFLINPAMNAPTDIETLSGLGSMIFSDQGRTALYHTPLTGASLMSLKFFSKDTTHRHTIFQKKLSAFSAEMTSCFTTLICSGRNSVRKIC